MAKVTVVGSIHVDFYISLPKLPVPGETVLGYKFIMRPGGKGANQAVAASRLDAKTFMVGRVGRDIFGEEIIKNFKKNGVNTDYISFENVHTGTAFIFLNKITGENMIAVAPGADSRVSNKDIDKAIQVIKSSSIVLLQLEIPANTVLYAAKRAWENRVKVILNPAPAIKLPPEVYNYVYVITPNRIEASLLSGINIRNYSDTIKAGKYLVKNGVKYAIITLGKRGAVIVSEKFTKQVPAFKVKVVDTTGAGDAFNGALARFLAEDIEITEAVKLANAAAALKITKLGAQEGLPSSNELKRFLEKYNLLS